MPRTATTDRVDRDALLDFLRPRHRAVLLTRRKDGPPQPPPGTGGVDDAGRVVVSTYPQRAKVVNARRDPRVSLCVLSDDFDGPWVQGDGAAGGPRGFTPRRAPGVSLCVLSDDFDGPWVQVDGAAEVLDLPDALEPLVEYYRAISGEHPDWAEYRAAMQRQGKSLVRVTIERWGPVATGGFPPGLAGS